MAKSVERRGIDIYQSREIIPRKIKVFWIEKPVLLKKLNNYIEHY